MKVATSRPENIRINFINKDVVTLGTFVPIETEKKGIIDYAAVIVNDRKYLWFEPFDDKDHVISVRGNAYRVDGYPMNVDTAMSLTTFTKLFGENPKPFQPIPLDKVDIDMSDIKPQKLLNDIKRFLRKYISLYNINMEIDEGMYELVAHWILYTHIYDIWNTCSYLKLMGDYGSGKSVFSQGIKMLSFLASSAESRISDAALYRSIHALGGVKLLDEITMSGSEQITFQNILKSGIQKRACAEVMNMNDYSKLDRHRLYCPKVVSGTDCENIDPILSSRMIEVVMQKTPKNDPRGREDIFSDAAWDEATKIRDRLYLFRLFSAHDFLRRKERITQTRYFQDSDLNNRFYDIYAPIFTISAYVSGKGVTKLLEDSATKQMEMRRVEIYQQLDVPILRMLYSHTHSSDDRDVWLTDTQISNEILTHEISNRIFPDKRMMAEKYSPESVGARIRGMGITNEHRENELGLQWKYNESRVMKIIMQKGLDFKYVSMSIKDQIEKIQKLLPILSKKFQNGVMASTMTTELGFNVDLTLKLMLDKGLVKYDQGRWFEAEG
jgi:hypothetical protein